MNYPYGVTVPWMKNRGVWLYAPTRCVRDVNGPARLDYGTGIW